MVLGMRYCSSCKRNVNTERSYSLGLAIILLLLFFIPGLIYLAWGIHKGPRCPICKTPDAMLKNPKFDELDEKKVEE